MGGWHHLSPAASECSLTVCMRERVGGRGKISPLTQGGVLGLPMFLPPLYPLLFNGVPTSVSRWLVLAALLSGSDLNPSRLIHNWK